MEVDERELAEAVHLLVAEFPEAPREQLEAVLRELLCDIPAARRRLYELQEAQQRAAGPTDAAHAEVRLGEGPPEGWQHLLGCLGNCFSAAPAPLRAAALRRRLAPQPPRARRRGAGPGSTRRVFGRGSEHVPLRTHFCTCNARLVLLEARCSAAPASQGPCPPLLSLPFPSLIWQSMRDLGLEQLGAQLSLFSRQVASSLGALLPPELNPFGPDEEVGGRGAGRRHSMAWEGGVRPLAAQAGARAWQLVRGRAESSPSRTRQNCCLPAEA